MFAPVVMLGWAIAVAVAVSGARRSAGLTRASWIVLAGVLALALASLLVAALIGSYVDEAGILREPFWLSAGGIILALAGTAGTAVLWLVSYFLNRSQSH